MYQGDPGEFGSKGEKVKLWFIYGFYGYQPASANNTMCVSTPTGL